MEDCFFSLFGCFLSRKQGSWFWQHRQQNPTETWADFKQNFISEHWKSFWKSTRTNLKNTYVEGSSVKDYIEHKIESLKLAFPEMNDRTLMIITAALVPEKFDIQLQEGVSLGIRHLNTMASVIDRTLGFQSSDDEAEVPNRRSAPLNSQTGTSGQPLQASTSSQSTQPDVDAKIAEKLDEFANGRLDTMFKEFLQSDSFTTKITTAIAAAMSRSK